MLKKIVIYIITSTFLITQISWALPEISQALPDKNLLRPKGTFLSDTRPLEKILADQEIPLRQRDTIHEKKIDEPLKVLIQQGKVKPLTEDDRYFNAIAKVGLFLFSEKGLGLQNEDLLRLFNWLLWYGQAKLVYADKRQWPVKGHSSNYGDKKARIHLRVYDNDDLPATFIHEFGVLLGKNRDFNNLLVDGFKWWSAGAWSSCVRLYKKELIQGLKDAKLHPNLKELITRDFTYCWGERLPEPEAFEEIKNDYEQMENDVVDDALENSDDLTEEGQIDKDDKKDIRKELKDNLNEDIIRDGLLAMALRGELGELSDKELLDLILDIIIRKLIGRFKANYGVKLSYDKLKQLLKDKQSIKKFLKTFKEKVIDKVKRQRPDKGSGAKTGGRTTSIPIRQWQDWEQQQEFGEGNQFSRINPSRLLKGLGYYIKQTIKDEIDRISQALLSIYGNFRRLLSIRVKVVCLDTGRGTFKMPVVFFADNQSADGPAAKPPPVAPPGDLNALFSQLFPQADPSTFYEDMLEKARNNEYEPFFVGEKQGECLSQIINRITKPEMAGIFLVGEAGCGKTAMVEQLARMIVNRKTRTWLDEPPRRNKPQVRLLKLKLAAFLETGNIINMTKLDALLNDVADGRTILFIDEAHILKQMPKGATDFFQYIKDPLTKDKLRIIISTTEDEAEKYVSGDKAMERRLKLITVPTPTSEETVEILERVMPDILKEVNPDGISADEQIYVPESQVYTFFKTLVKLTDRFRIGFGRPHAPKDAFTEALNWIRQRRGQNQREMESTLEQTIGAINNLAALRRGEDKLSSKDLIERRHREANKVINGINKMLQTFAKREDSFRFEVQTRDVIEANRFPVGSETVEDEEWLGGLEDRIRERVHGQDHVVSAVVDAVMIDRRGLRKRNRPIGVFYCAGPTGCGKTFIGKVLAEELYPGDNKAHIRIDMTEYAEKYRISNLIGAPKAYIGYDEKPELLLGVKERPCSVIVLDEAGEAHPDIFKFLLNLLERGEYKGIDFTKTVIFLTSNEGLEAKDYQLPPHKLKEKVLQAIQNKFPSQFYSRLTTPGMAQVLIFNFLSEPKMVDIVQRNLLQEVKRTFSDELGIEIELEEGTPSFLNTEAFSMNVSSPWAITDEGVVVSYDDKRSTLVLSKRGEEFVVGAEATEAETQQSKRKELHFEEGALSNPAMIRLTQKDGVINRYLVADKDAGVVCFNQEGKLERVIGEVTDMIEVVGDKVYFHSLEDGFIKSCALDGDNIGKFSKKAYPDLKAFAVNKDDGKLLSLSMVDASNRITLLDEKGDEKYIRVLDHTKEVKNKATLIKRNLNNILSKEEAFGKGEEKDSHLIKWYGPFDIAVTDNGTRYWLDMSSGTIYRQRPEDLLVSGLIADGKFAKLGADNAIVNTKGDFNLEFSNITKDGLAGITGQEKARADFHSAIFDPNTGYVYINDWPNRRLIAFEQRRGKAMFIIEDLQVYNMAVSGQTIYASIPESKKILAFNAETGEPIKLPSGMSGFEPGDLAASSNTLFVIDKTENKIRAFDTKTNLEKALLPHISNIEPTSLAIAPDDNSLYVVDKGKGIIMKFEIKTYKPGGTLQRERFLPQAITVSGGILYALDETTQTVRIFKADTGEEILPSDSALKRFNLYTKPEQFIGLSEGGFGFGTKAKARAGYLTKVLVDKLGFIYLYNKENKTIEKYTSTGKLNKKSESLKEIVEDVSDIALDNIGDIYLLDKADNCIYILDNKMKLVVDSTPVPANMRPEPKTIELSSIPDLDTENVRIYSIQDDRFYLYDPEKKEIYEISKKAKLTDHLKAKDIEALTLVGIVRYKDRWVAADSRGNLFFLDDKLGIIKEYTTSDRSGDYILSLSDGDIHLIRLADKNVLVFSDVNISPVVELIKEKGFSKERGARGVEGAGNKLLIEPLNKFFSKGNITKGDRVRVTRDGDKIRFERLKRREEPNPMAVLTEIAKGDGEFARILQAAEEDIQGLVESGEGKFTAERLIQILDFKPRNLKETKQFKPNKECKLKGRTAAEFEITLDSNSPQKRNYKDFTTKAKNLFSAEVEEAGTKFIELIKQAIGLVKIYNLNTTMKGIEAEGGIFEELQKELMDIEAESVSLQAKEDANKEAIEALTKEREALNQRVNKIIEAADANLGIKTSYVLTDKGELLVKVRIEKQPSLEEEEHLIDLFTYQAEALSGFDMRFGNEQDRAFAKARSEFLDLSDTVSGYEKSQSRGLIFWFKIKMDFDKFVLLETEEVGKKAEEAAEGKEEEQEVEKPGTPEQAKPQEAKPPALTAPNIVVDLSKGSEVLKDLEPLGVFGKDALFTKQLIDIALDPDGGYLYVADNVREEAGIVRKFSLKTEKEVYFSKVGVEVPGRIAAISFYDNKLYVREFSVIAPASPLHAQIFDPETGDITGQKEMSKVPEEVQSKLTRSKVIAQLRVFYKGIVYSVEQHPEVKNGCIMKSRPKFRKTLPRPLQGRGGQVIPAGFPVSSKFIDVLGLEKLGTELQGIAMNPRTGWLYISDAKKGKTIVLGSETDDEVELENEIPFYDDITISEGILYGANKEEKTIECHIAKTGIKVLSIKDIETSSIVVNGDKLYASERRIWPDATGRSKYYGCIREYKLMFREYPTAPGLKEPFVYNLEATYGKDRLSEGLGPLAIDPDTGYLYVRNPNGSAQVVVIDPKTDNEIILPYPIEGSNLNGMMISNGIFYGSYPKLTKTRLTGELRLYNAKTGQRIELKEPIIGGLPVDIAVLGDMVYFADDSAFQDKEGRSESGGVGKFQLIFEEPVPPGPVLPAGVPASEITVTAKLRRILDDEFTETTNAIDFDPETEMLFACFWKDDLVKVLRYTDEYLNLRQFINVRSPNGVATCSKYIYIATDEGIKRFNKSSFKEEPFENNITTANKYGDVKVDNEYLYGADTSFGMVRRFVLDTGEEMGTYTSAEGFIREWKIDNVWPMKIEISEGIIYIADSRSKTVKAFYIENQQPVQFKEEIPIGEKCGLAISGDILLVVSSKGLSLYNKRTAEPIELKDPDKLAVIVDAEKLAEAYGDIAASRYDFYLIDKNAFSLMTAGKQKLDPCGLRHYQINVEKKGALGEVAFRKKAKVGPPMEPKIPVSVEIAGIFGAEAGLSENLGPLVFNPDNGLIYLCDYGSRRIVVLDPETEEEVKMPNKIEGLTPEGITYGNNRIFVQDAGPGIIRIYDANSLKEITDKFTLPDFFESPSCRPRAVSDNILYVADPDRELIGLVNAESLEQITVFAGQFPSFNPIDLAISGNRLYAATSGERTYLNKYDKETGVCIGYIDAPERIGKFKSPAIAAWGDLVTIANQGDDKIILINAKTNKEVELDKPITGIYTKGMDINNGILYATNDKAYLVKDVGGKELFAAGGIVKYRFAFEKPKVESPKAEGSSKSSSAEWGINKANELIDSSA